MKGSHKIGGDGSWIAAGTLAAELWFGTEQQRELLIVQVRGLDGASWQKVVYTDNFQVHEEWHHVNSPAVCVPGAPRPRRPRAGAGAPRCPRGRH